MSAALTIRIPGDIRGKARPRFSRQAGRTYTDSKTAGAENWVRACAMAQVGQPVLDGPLAITMTVTVAVPPSWSKRKQADAISGAVRPTGRPDLDNIAKLVADALNGIVWRDDSQVVSMMLSKLYGEAPGAVIEIGAP